MISICLPTRKRPKQFKRMCLSALDNASNPDDIEFISYHDNDDTSEYEYVGNHKEIVGDRIILSQMWNECLKVATGDIYLAISDDFIFVTKGWDEEAKKAFDDYEDKIVFVFFDDGRLRSNHGSIFCVHKNWIDAIGYLLPPYFSSHNADVWMNKVATEIDRRVFLRGIFVKHLYEGSDSTHIDYMKRRKRDNPRQVFKSKIKEREEDARLLQEFIDNYRSQNERS